MTHCLHAVPYLDTAMRLRAGCQDCTADHRMPVKRSVALVCVLATILVTLLLAALPASAERTATASRPSQILLLNSYHRGYKWSDDIAEGIQSALSAAGIRSRFYVEYMDTKRVADELYFQQLYELYHRKFMPAAFDLVLASDDNAFSFLKLYGDRLFPGVPIVFCGVNYFLQGDMEGRQLFTGVNEDLDIRANIDLVLALHPGLRRIVFINDTTETGRKVRTRIEHELTLYRNRFETAFLDDLPMDDILVEVKKLAADSVIVFSLFFRDVTGNFFEYDESIALISRASPVPVYGLWDYSLGHGIVGGMLASGFWQGEIAGHLGARILRGEAPGDIPVVMESPNRYMFDYEQLARFGISPTALPAGSLITGRPQTLYQRYGAALWWVLAGFGTLLCIIALLAASVRRRLRAEHKLIDVHREMQKSHSLIRSMFEADPVGVSLIVGRVFKKANRRFCEITGYSESELLDQSTRMLYTDEQEFEHVGRNLYSRLELHGIGSIETLWQRKDGKIINVLLNISPLDPANQSAGFTSVVLDITKEKEAQVRQARLEEQLRQSQKMEAIGTLAGGIAHDFNNILSAIIGFTELARMKLDDKIRLQDYLEQVLKAGERAKNLVGQILAFSRCTGQEEQRLLDPASIFREALKLLRAFLPTTIEIRQNIQPGVRVKADQNQLHQVLMNLCTNAGYVMSDTGGVLTVELETVELDAAAIAAHPDLKPGKYAQVRVGDTGTGIHPDVIDKIFNPFFTTKPQDEGTGLGLSVVHGIVKSHGGDITVASEIGKGTKFTILLPCQDAVAENTGSVQEQATPQGTEQVLLVDDEPSIAQVEKDMLEMLGYTVSIFTGSIEALDAFNHAPGSFDIVVTDLTMPRMTGSEMVGLIRQVRPDMPVVVCTGYRNTVQEHAGDEDLRCRYVQKPASMHDLGCAVRWVLDDKDPVKLLH